MSTILRYADRKKKPSSLRHLRGKKQKIFGPAAHAKVALKTGARALAALKTTTALDKNSKQTIGHTLAPNSLHLFDNIERELAG